MSIAVWRYDFKPPIQRDSLPLPNGPTKRLRNNLLRPTAIFRETGVYNVSPNGPTAYRLEVMDNHATITEISPPGNAMPNQQQELWPGRRGYISNGPLVHTLLIAGNSGEEPTPPTLPELFNDLRR